MTDVLNGLTAELEWDLQRQIAKRVEAMKRHLRFLAESENEWLATVQRIGWTDQQLEILCELNSFYQIVLGPLTSSSRIARGQVLGAEVPIHYGTTLTFDRARAQRIRSTMASFMGRMRRLGIPQQCLTAARADDLLRAVLETTEEQISPNDETGYDDVPF